MKKIFLMTVMLFCFVLNNAEGSELKIGYVDLNKALNESEKGKQAIKIMEDMIDKKKTLISQIEKENGAIDEKNKRKKIQKMQSDVNEKEKELRELILKDLIEIIKKIGEEEGYTAIIESFENIIYESKEFDMHNITDKLIERYDELSRTNTDSVKPSKESSALQQQFRQEIERHGKVVLIVAGSLPVPTLKSEQGSYILNVTPQSSLPPGMIVDGMVGWKLGANYTVKGYITGKKGTIWNSEKQNTEEVPVLDVLKMTEISRTD